MRARIRVHMTREEILVIVDGTARATIDGVVEEVAAGGAIAVPPHTAFSLAAAGGKPLVAFAYLPVGASEGGWRRAVHSAVDAIEQTNRSPVCSRCRSARSS